MTNDQAKDVIKFALVNDAFITSVVATDEAFSDRSIHLKFTKEESKPILEAVQAVLEVR